MELRPGYKQTEVGVTPRDWEVISIRDVALVEGGYAFSSKKFFSSGKYQVIKMSNLYGNNLDLDRGMSFLNQIDNLEEHYLLKENDILITLTGTVGKKDYGYTYRIRNEKNLVLNQRVARIVSNKNVDAAYLAFQINTPIFSKQFFDVAKGGTGNQANVGTKDIEAIKIPLPPLPEQRSIAAALSDMDALIRGLDQLIAKKRDLKQAAMQQLLTGKQRLPGFRGEWEVRRLGDIGATYGGLTGKTKADFGNGSAQYIPFLNVITNVVIDPNNLEWVRVSASEGQHQAQKGDLFFNGSSETPEEVGMCSVLLDDFQNIYLNSFCFGFRLREAVGINGLWLAYFFRSSHGRVLLYSLAQGATRYNLSKTNFLKLEIALPEPDEQAAIATVLADMDAEIAALEQLRDKTRDLKQGMMQELLTGRIRLV